MLTLVKIVVSIFLLMMSVATYQHQSSTAFEIATAFLILSAAHWLLWPDKVTRDSSNKPVDEEEWK